MEHAAHNGIAQVFGGLALLIVAARVGGHVASRLRLPTVIGELAAGLLLGNMGLAALRALRMDPVLAACAEIGVLVLLFEVGLESNLAEIGRVGVPATLVAVVGVLLPLALGTGVSALFDASESLQGHLFVGATLAATSVGITARVLRDLGRTQSREARIILAAAVLDDVLGLVLLALVAAGVRAVEGAAAISPATIALLLVKSLGFVVGAVVLGRVLVPRIFAAAARLAGKGTLVTTALALCFAYGFAADRFGLAPAIGAFFAGLAIRPADYAALTQRGEGMLEEPLAPLAAVFVPLFFVLAGARVDLAVFGNLRVVGIAAVLTLVAIAGKLAAGAFAGRRGVNRWAVGVGMVPRGEVGLIFASVGAELTLHGRPMISPGMFGAIVVMVVVTSLLPPPLLARLMREPKAHGEAVEGRGEAGRRAEVTHG
jgi:Kef-type K+ transport system membrane component KefB